MTDEILARAKIIAGITGDDEALSLYVEDAVHYVIEYCRLTQLPLKLYGITAQLAAKAYKSGNDGIASVKEGDRQISYVAFDSVIGGFERELAPFVNRNGRVPSEVRDV